MAIARYARNFLIAAAVALAAPAPAAAQTAPSEDGMQAARDLFTLMSPDLLNQITTGITQQFWPMIQRELAGKIDAAGEAQMKAEFERIQRENLAEMMKDAPQIYARHFTAAELRELIAFYRTPVGQKSLQKMPQIMADTVQIVVPRMPEIQAKAQASFEKVLRDRGYIK